MIMLKTKKDIDFIRKSSSLLVRTHAELAKVIKPGISSMFLDNLAEEFIRDNGATPAFKGYNNFPNTLCVSPDSEVVHGIPNKKTKIDTSQTDLFLSNLNLSIKDDTGTSNNETEEVIAAI